MKIRQGFVSNSSSSSFILAIKTESDQIGPAEVTEITQVPQTSVLFKAATDFVNFLTSGPTTIDELLANYGYSSVENAESYGDERLAMMADLAERGFKLFCGYASYNETSDPIELLIGNGGIGTFNSGNVVFLFED